MNLKKPDIKISNMLAYHYTNIDTLEKVLAKTSKDNPKIRLRATHVNFLNDGMENTLGLMILPKCIAQIEKELNVEPSQALTPLVMNSSYMNQMLFHLKSFDESNHGINKFVISLSEEADNVVMWSMYGNKGNGIAIGFDTDDLNPDSKKFYNPFKEKCIYWSDEMLKSKTMDYNSTFYHQVKNFYAVMTGQMIRDAFRKISIGDVPENQMDFHINDILATNLVSFCSIYNKLSIWSNEKEFRISLDTIAHNIRYYKNNSGIYVPYVDVDYPLKALKEIVIGPTCGRNAMGMLRSLFYEKGITDAVPMKYSTCPLQ